MKRESRLVEVITGPVFMRNRHQGARDGKTDTGTTRSESKLELPDRREEEETKNEKKRGDMKNGNGNVKSHVKGSVTHKGKGSWMRLGSRKGWLTGEAAATRNGAATGKRSSGPTGRRTSPPERAT